MRFLTWGHLTRATGQWMQIPNIILRWFNVRIRRVSIKTNESKRILGCVAMVVSVATFPGHGKSRPNPLGSIKIQSGHVVSTTILCIAAGMGNWSHSWESRRWLFDAFCFCCCCCCLFYPPKVANIIWPPNIWKNSVALVAPTICQWQYTSKGTYLQGITPKNHQHLEALPLHKSANFLLEPSKKSWLHSSNTTPAVSAVFPFCWSTMVQLFFRKRLDAWHARLTQSLPQRPWSQDDWPSPASDVGTTEVHVVSGVFGPLRGILCLKYVWHSYWKGLEVMIDTYGKKLAMVEHVSGRATSYPHMEC